jgi:hypothetical protein
MDEDVCSTRILTVLLDRGAASTRELISATACSGTRVRACLTMLGGRGLIEGLGAGTRRGPTVWRRRYREKSRPIKPLDTSDVRANLEWISSYASTPVQRFNELEFRPGIDWIVSYALGRLRSLVGDGAAKSLSFDDGREYRMWRWFLTANKRWVNPRVLLALQKRRVAATGEIVRGRGIGHVRDHLRLAARLGLVEVVEEFPRKPSATTWKHLDTDEADATRNIFLVTPTFEEEPIRRPPFGGFDYVGRRMSRAALERDHAVSLRDYARWKLHELSVLDESEFEACDNARERDAWRMLRITVEWNGLHDALPEWI